MAATKNVHQSSSKETWVYSTKAPSRFLSPSLIWLKNMTTAEPMTRMQPLAHFSFSSFSRLLPTNMRQIMFVFKTCLKHGCVLKAKVTKYFYIHPATSFSNDYLGSFRLSSNPNSPFPQCPADECSSQTSRVNRAFGQK